MGNLRHEWVCHGCAGTRPNHMDGSCFCSRLCFWCVVSMQISQKSMQHLNSPAGTVIPCLVTKLIKMSTAKLGIACTPYSRYNYYRPQTCSPTSDSGASLTWARLLCVRSTPLLCTTLPLPRTSIKNCMTANARAPQPEISVCDL